MNNDSRAGMVSVKFDTKTDARLRILRNAAEVCRLISEESFSDPYDAVYWVRLRSILNDATDLIKREASDD